MLTLIGSLLGFGSSLLPKVFEFFQERADRAHELAIIDRQMEQMKLGSALKLEEINAKADIAETKAIYKHDASIKPATWVDNLRGSVRPIVTYLLLLTFIGIQAAGFYMLVNVEGAAVYEAIMAINSENFQAMLAAVISFWFGSRAMNRK
jgi:hypothetical protein